MYLYELTPEQKHYMDAKFREIGFTFTGDSDFIWYTKELTPEQINSVIETSKPNHVKPHGYRFISIYRDYKGHCLVSSSIPVKYRKYCTRQYNEYDTDIRYIHSETVSLTFEQAIESFCEIYRWRMF